MKICRIPIITIPDIYIIYYIGFIGRVDGNNLIPCFITFSVIEFSLIPKSKTSSLSFFWTERWTGNKVFLASKCRRDFFVEFEIFVGDEKLLSADTTDFLFDYFFVGRNEGHGV